VTVSEFPALSVVLPTFNESAWLPETLERLRAAIAAAELTKVEIVVVDDGSTDDTAAVLDRQPRDPALEVLTLANSGRLAARRAGLDAATGELVLFIDSRVHAHIDSLAFVRREIEAHPERLIWNGHAITASTSAPWTRFWDAIVFLAWRRYLRQPTTTSYGADDFEYYPKGTTFFLAPKEWLIEASDSVNSLSADPALSNDDTIMIRNLLRYGRINISPEFACTYHPRSTFRAFMRNAYHRGSVLVDGHLRPGLRFHRPFQAVLLALPLAVLWAVRRPRRLVAGPIGASAAAGVLAKAAGVPTRDAGSLGLLLVPFSIAYGAGIVRGFRVRDRGDHSMP